MILQIFENFTPNDWMVVLTASLVGITALQVLVYVGIHRSAKRVERAYLYVDGITEFSYQSGERPRITFVVKNSGRTPAKIISVGAALITQDLAIVDPLPTKIPIDDSRGRVNFHLVTDQGTFFSPTLFATIDPADHRDVTMGRKRLLACARIRYRDRFQWWWQHRYVNACFIYDPAASPGRPTFTIATDSYNDAD